MACPSFINVSSLKSSPLDVYMLNYSASLLIFPCSAHQAQPAAEQPWKDPYEVIKMPQLPDLSRSPWGKELQVFREQCATGLQER